MTIALKQAELRKVDIATRMPFRYGIATVTAEPCLLVFANFEVDGEQFRGVAADVLPPKWFTKKPEASIEAEIEEMLMVIRTACGSALEMGEQENVFRWWQQLYQIQISDRGLARLPPLLKSFGVSLLERAAIDATCRRQTTTFHRAVQENLLGIRLEDLHAELAGCNPAMILPKKPRPTIGIRHTVGLSDPLRDSKIAEDERLNDGLPQSLEACIRRYGITYFKIKLPASIDEARTRLHQFADLVGQSDQSCQFTLDGNEFYTDPNEFRNFWEEVTGDRRLKKFLQEGLLVIEQPLHRDVALSEDAMRAFKAWPDRPPIIIDESDGEISSLRQALETGYAGTSHKNCKGVIKGLSNACLLRYGSSE